MKGSRKRKPSFGEQAEALLESMTAEELMAAIEERCPELIHGRGPRPPGAMVPGPLIDSGPSIEAAWKAERAKVLAEKKQQAKAVAARQRAPTKTRTARLSD
jgi:hypothetical protein